MKYVTKIRLGMVKVKPTADNLQLMTNIYLFIIYFIRYLAEPYTCCHIDQLGKNVNKFF